MKLHELYKAVNTALDNQADPKEFEVLTRHSHEIAALTTWAPGVIDPEGKAAEFNMRLETKARVLYQQRPHPLLAELHDALMDLRVAIKQHDEDLLPSTYEGYPDGNDADFEN